MRLLGTKRALFGGSSNSIVINLDFANNKYYKSDGSQGITPATIPGWTYSGGVNGATSQRSDGTWVVYGASGVPRIAAPSSITNLAVNSSDTSQASWGVGAATKTTGQADPLGGTGAALLTADGTNAQHNFTASNASTTFTAGTTYTFSRMVKAGTQSLVQLAATSTPFGGTGYANFNLSNGTVTASAGMVGNGATITALAGGWYRISITALCATSASGTYGGVMFFIASGSDSRGPTNSLATTFYDFGAMVDPSPILRPYVATTSAAKTVDDYTAVRGNLWLNSSGTQTVTTVIGQKYTVSLTGSGSVAFSGGGSSGTVSAGSPITFVSSGSGSATGTVSGSVSVMFEPVLYTNATLANTTTAFSYPTAFIPTTSAAVYAYDTQIGGPGLLVEEASTNSIRNNSMAGAVAGTPGTLPTNWSFQGTSNGLAINVIGAGTEFGLPYIDLQWVGTPSASSGYGVYFEPATGGPAAVSGQTWAQSGYARIVGGSLTNVALVYFDAVGRTSGGSSSSDSGAISLVISPTSTIARVSNAATLASATTVELQPGFSINYTNGNAINLTLRIYSPQLEQKAYATSPIVTTNAAVTRAADIAYVTGLCPGSTPTLFGRGYYSAATGNNQYMAELNDGTDNNRMSVIPLTAGANIFTNSTTYATSSGSNPGIGVPAKLAYSAVPGSQLFSQGGSTIAGSTAPTVPTMNQVNIGNLINGTRPLDGYISQVTVRSKALTQTQLNTATK